MRSSSTLSSKIVLNSAIAALLVGLGLLVYKPLTTGQVNSKAAKEQRQPASPLAASSKNSEEGNATESLTQRIDRAIDEGEVASARWGISVVSMRDGRVLYSRNADKLFTPASNMKIYTTAVALDLLGADHEWRTSV